MEPVLSPQSQRFRKDDQALDAMADVSVTLFFRSARAVSPAPREPGDGNIFGNIQLEGKAICECIVV